MSKEVITIIRKNYPNTVLKVKVGDLDKTKCSHRFIEHGLNPELGVYIKCDKEGNIEYRGKKQQYRLFDILKHERKE